MMNLNNKRETWVVIHSYLSTPSTSAKRENDTYNKANDSKKLFGNFSTVCVMINDIRWRSPLCYILIQKPTH